MRRSRLISAAALLACGQLVVCWQLAGCQPSPPTKSPASRVPSAEATVRPGEATTDPEPSGAEADSPFDTSAAVAQSAELTRLLLAGSTVEALRQFSPAYRDGISIDELDALSEKLRALLGDQVTGLELVDSTFVNASFAASDRALRIRYLIQMASGKQAISTTQFFLTEDDSSVLQAELSALDIRETWPSYSPTTHQLALQAMELLLAAKSDSMAKDNAPVVTVQTVGQSATAFSKLLHPDIGPFFLQDALPAVLDQIQKRCGGLRRQPQWSLWSYQTDGEHISAAGNIRSELGEVDVQLDFSQEKLIGVTLIGDTFAVSTLDLLTPQPATAELGKQFWRQVFSDNLAAAHQLLGSEFQRELPSEQFELAIASSELIGDSPLKNITLDTVRFSNRLQRADPVALAAYYIAVFEDGSQQAVQCEFGSHAAPPPLLSFTNDVQATLPSSDIADLQRIVAAFLSGDVDDVRQLLDSAGQENFQTEIASLFLNQLRQLVGSLTPALQSMRVLHAYRGSVRTDHLRAELTTEAAPVIFVGTVQAGKLTSFKFLAPQLDTFVHSLEDFEPIEEFGREFIRQWMKKDQTAQAAEKMTAAEDPRILADRLAAQRDQLLGEHGNFFWSDLLSWQAIDGSNQISAVYELEFADQTLDMQLMFDISAIAAEVSSARILKTE